MIIPFPSLTVDANREPIDQAPVTLASFYRHSLLPSRQVSCSRRTVSSDLDAVSAWTACTSDVDLSSLLWLTETDRRQSLKLLRSELQMFVRNQLDRGVSAVSINTRLRHIRAILRIAADPIDHGLIGTVPDLGRHFTGTKSAWQVKAKRKPQRDTITAEELTRLFAATSAADDPHRWKVILLLLWSYGARTEDTFFRLDWSLVDRKRMLLQFTANKTSKLQGVPLTPLLAAALESLPVKSGPLFGPMSRGGWTASQGWKAGYYCTWSRDILPAGRFRVNRGPAEHRQTVNQPDSAPNVMFHHFRKTMVTELNRYSDKAGNWVAAHYMSGVSEQFYDQPAERIREAVQVREAERLPDECRRYFLSNS